MPEFVVPDNGTVAACRAEDLAFRYLRAARHSG